MSISLLQTPGLSQGREKRPSVSCLGPSRLVNHFSLSSVVFIPTLPTHVHVHLRAYFHVFRYMELLGDPLSLASGLKAWAVSHMQCAIRFAQPRSAGIIRGSSIVHRIRRRVFISTSSIPQHNIPFLFSFSRFLTRFTSCRFTHR